MKKWLKRIALWLLILIVVGFGAGGGVCFAGGAGGAAGGAVGAWFGAGGGVDCTVSPAPAA